ncbi:hypothetical protein FVA95_08955 [Pseudonocardia sp. EV170527-09]|uniref:hypothetical protein n=1 Tax=Pseudonocardia sp. EV170527-09 TaxID=2603411 RepID=UPI0011F0E785|nr:hypothetical protein [Pseudonocardia sp. EV170527-09]KAA1031132.1 hypothetical protein FVA95_08955 [Pseudonocardia sp. EV170527-09]
MATTPTGHTTGTGDTTADPAVDGTTTTVAPLVPAQRSAPEQETRPAAAPTAVPTLAPVDEPVAAEPARETAAPVVPRARAFRARVLPVFLCAAATGTAAIAAAGLIMTPPATSPLPTPQTVTASGATVPQGPPLPQTVAASLVGSAAGTGLWAGDPVVAMTAWRDNGGLTHLTAIGDGFTRVADAAARQDAVALAVACGRLRTAVDAARAYDAVPDAAAQTSWAALLDHGAAAATAGTSGALALDPSQLSVFTTQANLVRDDLTAVTDRVRAVLAG